MTSSFDGKTHEELGDLVGAYADGELDPERRARVEAHLTDCVRCRNDLELQRLARGALASARRHDPASSAAFEKTMLEGLRARATRPSGARRSAWLAASGWAVAAALALVVVLERGWSPRSHEFVPMAEQAVGQYRARLADPAGVPIGAVDVAALGRDTGLSLVALGGPAQMLGGWRTRIRGEDAVAIAYRYGSRIVVQYVVSRGLFERQAVVREAVAAEGHFVMRDGEMTVVAWPVDGAGVLLVGEVPAAELAQLRRI